MESILPQYTDNCLHKLQKAIRSIYTLIASPFFTDTINLNRKATLYNDNLAFCFGSPSSSPTCCVANRTCFTPLDHRPSVSIYSHKPYETPPSHQICRVTTATGGATTYDANLLTHTPSHRSRLTSNLHSQTPRVYSCGSSALRFFL